METVSVIIPVYNTAAYLKRCVDSITSQTFGNLEILLVDDGSTDGSAELCDDLAVKDQRIRVIHKTNGGLSDARNAGAAYSKGAYIAFVDSDDWVAPDYIDYLLSLIRDTEADCSVCGFQGVSGEKDIKVTKERKRCFFNDTEALQNMLYQIDFDTSAWGKLYRREIVLENPYPVGRYYEDLFTTYKMLSGRKVSFGSRQLYYYFQRSDSIMNSDFSPKQFDQLEAVDDIEEFINEHYPALADAVQSRKYSSYCQVLLRMPKDKSIYTEEKRKIWSYIRSKRRAILFDKNTRLKNKICALLSLFGEKALRLAYKTIR